MYSTEDEVSTETNEQTDLLENDKGNESGTINELPNVQNDSLSESLTSSKSYGSTNYERSLTSLENVGWDSEESGHHLDQPAGNRSGSFTSGRRSVVTGVSRQSSIHVLYVEPPGDETYKRFSFWSSTRQQKLLLIAMASVDFSSNMCLSILAPFFPDEASRKGVSTTTSGWIFGMFALVQFISSPIFGKMLPKVGARFLFLTGQFFGGGCTILFGLLDYISIEDGPDLFIIYCFVLRAFLALGCAASGTASFAITASAYPDNVGTVFGLLETFTGLGLMVGPALGGVLYEYGGFVTPFTVLGGIMLVTVPLNACILPKQDEGAHETEPGSIFQLLRIPSIFIVCLAVVIGTLVWAILDPTLQPHLVQFDISPTTVGLIFLLMSAFYAIFSPIWGIAADRMKDSTPLLILGFIGSGIGLLLLGPSPVLGFAIAYNELWLNLVALIILGTCSSLAVIPTFDKIIDACDHAGIEDTLGMYSVVAGLWSAFYALGDFVGPSLGGLLVDLVGFEWTMTCVAVTCAVMALLLFSLWIWERKFGPTPMWGKQPDMLHKIRKELIESPEVLERDSGISWGHGEGLHESDVMPSNERTPLLSSTPTLQASTKVVTVNGCMPVRPYREAEDV